MASIITFDVKSALEKLNTYRERTIHMLSRYECSNPKCRTSLQRTPETIRVTLSGQVYLHCWKCGKLSLIEDNSAEYYGQLQPKEIEHE